MQINEMIRNEENRSGHNHDNSVASHIHKFIIHKCYNTISKKHPTTRRPAAKTLKTQQVEGFRIREKPAIFLVVINRDINACTRKTFAWSRFFAKFSVSVKP